VDFPIRNFDRAVLHVSTFHQFDRFLAVQRPPIGRDTDVVAREMALLKRRVAFQDRCARLILKLSDLLLRTSFTFFSLCCFLDPDSNRRATTLNRRLRRRVCSSDLLLYSAGPNFGAW
jgi:hypothetical protein